MADSSDVTFQQVITFGCLSKLLTWAKAKQQSLKSSADNTGSLPTDLSAAIPQQLYKPASRGLSAIAELLVNPGKRLVYRRWTRVQCILAYLGVTMHTIELYSSRGKTCTANARKLLCVS